MASPILQLAPLGFPWQTLDPFLFCVHHNDAYPEGDSRMGPRASLTGRSLGNDFSYKDGWSMYHGHAVPGFPQHPHRGFETITVARQGVIDHSDSMGAAARFGRGDVQWMTAGSGVVHSEMFPLIKEDSANPMELFQIWLNLPAKSKMAKPYFSMYWDETIPRVAEKDASGRVTELVVFAGEHPGAKGVTPPPDSWAAEPSSDLKIMTIRMEPGAEWTLPAAAKGTNRVIYFFSGSTLHVAGQEIPPRHAVLLEPDVDAALRAGSDACEILLLQGRPIGEPVAQYGPFVMNTELEIHQAFEDYRRTQFGGWPWPDDAPVHERSQGRFARHADGRIETPPAAI
jgi:redox-sensitive bicupin YhaK (pirin superfamily)